MDTRMQICKSVSQYIYISFSLSIHLSLFAYISTYIFIYLSIYSVCVSICAHMSTYILGNTCPDMLRTLLGSATVTLS